MQDDQGPTHAWLTSGLTVHRAVLDAIDAQSLAEYPSEACGFITGPAAQPLVIDRAIAAVNLADKYHKVDPETFPRTSREYYTIDARLIQRTFEQGERDGQPVKVIYHSHCDCGAYFSQTDQDAAAPDGQLAYPVAYLVTSVMEGKIAERQLFAFIDSAWQAVPLSVRESL
ncbi:MAG: Mov34/MPN/PAD-1 family protein [Deltaproteobacteria bacterium]|nr:Mov34/MPN/PAD-1 family protein [Deltaproteobacteria bacterium]